MSLLDYAGMLVPSQEGEGEEGNMLEAGRCQLPTICVAQERINDTWSSGPFHAIYAFYSIHSACNAQTPDIRLHDKLLNEKWFSHQNHTYHTYPYLGSVEL